MSTSPKPFEHADGTTLHDLDYALHCAERQVLDDLRHIPSGAEWAERRDQQNACLGRYAALRRQIREEQVRRQAEAISEVFVAGGRA